MVSLRYVQQAMQMLLRIQSFCYPALRNTPNQNMDLRSKTAQVDCETVYMQCMSLPPSPDPTPASAQPRRCSVVKACHLKCSKASP